jgi:Xaa-Pro aminopeptidase
VQIWSDRPSQPDKPAFVHPLELSGKPTADKVDEIRRAMAAEGASLLVVAALDELAWLLNIRGSDVDYNPVWCVCVECPAGGEREFSLL